ncbi:hypothetical protein LU699_18045 [Luteimonas fraxinea]|uniref:hypothetical protein n=1 Tax=Luteimonas fraxinea TaxID=2901869 RepID=UPI001E3E0B3B|nr:hypothetical protein [Luteimonas fraxinea]UHH10127.1 hypothetical protein LU699_18045 [Luteimonas fraxinea]
MFNVQFYVDIKKWRAFKSSASLNWQRTRFLKANKSSVPKERGVYAFTVLMDSPDMPTHGYILYMGITGDSSGSDLQVRYGQYLADARRMSKRVKVCAMLDQWKDDLFFNFAPVPDKRVSLAKIERSFLSAIVPPVNKTDIDASVRDARDATW